MLSLPHLRGKVSFTAWLSLSLKLNSNVPAMEPLCLAGLAKETVKIFIAKKVLGLIHGATPPDELAT